MNLQPHSFRNRTQNELEPQALARLGIVFVLSFAAVGYLGWQFYLAAPPVEEKRRNTYDAFAVGGVLLAGYAVRRLRRPAQQVPVPVGTAAAVRT
jgi:hypothetical protein